MALTFALLGPFKIEDEVGRDLTSSLEHKTRAILAYVAAADEPVTRRHLWSIFCQSAKDPAGSLRWHLSRIRRLLPTDPLTVTPQTVAFNFQKGSTDLKQFEQIFSDPAAQPMAALQQAFALFRGPFCENLELNRAAEFDLWLLAERSRLQQLFERGSLVLIGRTIAQGDHTAAVTVALTLLSYDPLLEKVHHQLIWLYATVGQKQSALAQYEQCRLLLSQELAVDPSPDIFALAEAVRHNRPLPSPQVNRSPTPGHPPDRSARPAGEKPHWLTTFWQGLPPQHIPF